MSIWVYPILASMAFVIAFLCAFALAMGVAGKHVSEDILLTVAMVATLAACVFYVLA